MFFRINSFRNGLLAGLMACLAALPAAAVAQDKVLSTTGNSPDGAVVVSTEQVRKGFEQRFPGLPVTEVSSTPFAGLFEVRIGTDLVYVDAEVNYVLQGSLIDAKTRSDLTAKRIAKLSEVDIDTLPLKDAIKQVRGDGSRRMVVFEDPNCGYCKMLHENLRDIDNVTVYTFLYPILSPDSHTRSRNIWCAADSAETWRAWMLEGVQPAVAECDTPIEANLQLGRGLMVTGTPAIFFADGSRMNGAMPADALERKLAEAAAKE
ncbi:DsbC family protein [Alcaligenaceae bacterium]|nr:DsbC family protein [Alcaligenaceae bacterium]